MDEFGTVRVSWAQGYASDKIRHIDAHTICYACGSNLKFVDTESKEEIVFKSPGNGISTFATSPSHRVFALAESCLNPRIFICCFPSMEVVSILHGETPLEFKLLSFSFSEKYLASYSGIPDFTFAAWNWETGKLLCKHEMDSDSPITSMSFNPLSYHHIAVSGPESVIILNLEDCNELHTIKPKNISLPAEDGSSVDDEENISRSATRLESLITLPPATKAGLIGKAAKKFKAPDQRKRQLQPSTHCWSTKGEIYVGCSNGQLFQVDVETGRVTILLSDLLENLLSGQISGGMFNTLCLNSQGLYAGGMDGVLRSIVIEKDGVNITTVCELGYSICTVSISPVLCNEFIMGSTAGYIEKYNVSTKTCDTVSSTHFGQFVGAVYGDGGNLCISCREDGEVQVWEAETGKLMSSISVGTKATSISASSSCSLVAVGSWTGHIYYIDIKDDTNLRIVERHRLHHGPVTFLQFSKFGNFLLSSSTKDTQIFVINAKPSAEFVPIGYIECMYPIENVTMSTLDSDTTYISVVVTPSQESDEVDDDEESNEATSDRVLLFTLSKDMLENPDEHYQSLRNNFKDESINRLTFDLTVPLDSALVTAVNSSFSVVGLGKFTKKLYYFKLPLSFESEDSTTIHNPCQEHKAHELSNGSLALSQHNQWLISYSLDGMIVLRDINSPSSTVSIQSHSFLSAGVLSASFSPDGQRIISVGKNDMSLVSYSWNLTSKGKVAMNSALEYSRSIDMQLRSITEQEDCILIVLPDWVEPALSETRVASATSFQSEEEPVDLPKEERGDPEGGEESQRPTSGAARSEITMTPTPVPAADSTWYDSQLIVAVKKENEKYDDVKRKLRKNIKELRKTILAMMENNRLKPDIEQLDEEDYNLDVEEQQRLQQEAEKRIQQVKDDIEFENLAQRYLKYLLQKECWDDMIVKGRAIKSFNTNVTVTNYPMREQTQNEIEMLRKVNRMRTIEIEELAARKEIVEITTTKNTTGEEEEDEEEVVHPDKLLSLHGSLGPKYGGENELFHSQLDLHTREQKISQIVLVKDAIRRVKVAFNEAFATIYRNKEQEIGRAKEKNVRIREIIQELDIAMESVKDPQMDIDEKPENVFVVADEEVTVERVLSKEQEQQLEIERKEEEARIEAARGDNKRERALDDMMGGVLEVKKEDMLKQDIDAPEFMTEKLEKDWTDEEKKLAKEHEKRVKDLQEEREKYRKNLENELKKLQQGMTDSMVAYDEQLLQLYNRKVKTEMVINQEELKILRLSAAILIDDEINVQEKQLNYLMAFAEKNKSHSNTTEEKIRNLVDAYREVYDKVVAEDKMLDRSFKRDFSDVPLSLVDQLYKLFKRRPRVQRQHAVDPTVKSYNPFGQATSLHSEVSKLTLESLTEMDDIVNAPEGTDPIVWQRLCTSRKGKVESELRVKECAVILAGMSQYFQRRQEENEMLSREIEDVTKQLNKLCEDRMKNNLNLQIQFLLKQGQVEVETGDFIPDYSDSILIHRGVVEDLNGSIRGLGESKIAAMTESKDFKKGIHQLEWERKRMIMQMEDLHNKARHIQMLKLTKDLQLYLNEENYHARQSKQIAVLEKTLELQDEHLKKYLSQKQEMIAELERTIRQKEYENHTLEKELQELHVSVSERKNISDVNAAERAKNTADKRLRGIVQRRKLVDLAKAQAQEVAVLRAEVERLRMKTFPALVQVER